MKAVIRQLAPILAFASLAQGQEQTAPAPPTWEEKIAQGLVPHHQLTVEDFKIDDQAHPEGSYWVQPFVHPHWQYLLKWKDGWHYAYIVDWLIFSGLDKNGSSRKSKFREMKRALPFAQAYLDIFEIHARQLAGLKPGEFPSARAATAQEARTALQQNMDAFLKEKYKPMLAELEEFVKATNHGRNEKKVRELAKAIRKRLDAIPLPAKLPDAATPATTPVSSPFPQASGTPVSK
jgi:hypothetical protein